MPELIEAYPDAKVIVSERDPEKWYASFEATVGRSMNDWAITVLAFFDPFFLGHFTPFIAVMPRMFGHIMDPEHIKQSYVNLHEEVRQLVPEDKRLEYHLGDGWEPLCKFLGKDVPKGSFPFINESVEYTERINLLQSQALRRIMKKVLPVAGLVGFASSYYFGLLPRW